MSKDKSLPPEKNKGKPSPAQIRDYELAGGMEGGMPAGDAGGPGQDVEDRPAKDKKA